MINNHDLHRLTTDSSAAANNNGYLLENMKVYMQTGLDH